MQFEALKEKLLAGGIAPRRVRRYLGELEDHLAELTQTELAAGTPPDEAAIRARALLGSDNDLAEAWLSDPRLRSFMARAPWAVIPAALLLFMVLGFAVCIVPWLAIGFGGRFLFHAMTLPDWFARLSHLVSVVSNFLAPPLAASLLAGLVRRQRLNLLWAALPALLLLVTRPSVDVDSAPHSMSVGAGYMLLTEPADLLHLPFSTSAFILQAALILAPSLWLVIGQYRRRRQIGHAV